MDTLTTFSLSILAAFWSGFYVGFFKREGRAPEMPLPTIKEVINSVRPERKEKLSKAEQREQAKANSFYN